jgi:hypothetical protein
VGNWHVVDVAALKFALSHARLDLLVTAALLSVLSQWANPRLFGESMVDLRAVITGSRKLRRDDIISRGLSSRVRRAARGRPRGPAVPTERSGWSYGASGTSFPGRNQRRGNPA